MKFVVVLALGCCASALSLAQTSSKPLEFEVASIRPVASSAGQVSAGGARSSGAGLMSETPDRISYKGVTLKRMLSKAYDLKPYQLSGPAWMDDEHYDVLANIPEGTTKEQISEMLQSLLTNRFRITLHSETKEESVYLLGIGKDGQKLKPAADGERASMGFSPNPETGQEKLTYRAQTMANLANSLSVDLDRPVIDKTGLDGKFDMTLQAESQQGTFAPLPSSLFSAVRALGLQLEPGKAPVNHLVIDKAQKIPTEN